jgi:hypothetical protein
MHDMTIEIEEIAAQGISIGLAFHITCLVAASARNVDSRITVVRLHSEAYFVHTKNIPASLHWLDETPP